MTAGIQEPGTTTLRDEVCRADLGDQRLNSRLARIVETLGAQPTLSIPAAADRRAEMEAAYRFFNNDKVTPQKILEPHIAASRERISQCDRVLLVQDTTELDLTRPSQQVAGAGPMDSEVRRGAFVHSLMAFNVHGLPLGTVWQTIWTRTAIDKSQSDSERSRQRNHTPIEDKESYRWVEGVRAARQLAAEIPQTACICVSDSEADIYELFSEPRAGTAEPGSAAPPVELLVRACQKRNTQTGNWLADVRATACLAEHVIRVSKRTAKIQATPHKRGQSRDARTATVEVRAAQVTLQPPWRFDRTLPPLTLNVVLVEEREAPAGCLAVQWLLVTTLPIDTLDQVQEIVRYYCLRWQIEIFFRTLKSGCRVEQRLFERLPPTLNCVAVYSIIAWRVMYLCQLGRECPDLNCEVVLSPSEWKSVYRVVRRQPLPAKPPRLNEMIRMIATLGGYIERRHTEPGPQTLWIGMQRLHSFSLAWDTFGPDA